MREIGILTRLMVCFSLLIVFLSTGLAQQKQTGPSNRTPIKIGIIKDSSFFENNAGCFLQLTPDDRKNNKRFVFLSDYDDNGLINIGGKDIKLKLRTHKSASDVDEDPQVGSKSTEIFDGPGLTVKVDFVATRVCPPDDESCEVTYYDATIMITSKKTSKTVKVKGLCGS